MEAVNQINNDSVVEIAFVAGSTAVYAADSNSTLEFDFNTDDVLFEQQGGDLLITNPAGDSVVIQGYVEQAAAGAAPHVVIDGGIIVAGDVFLFSVNHDATAAGNALSGGGLNEYSSDPGTLFAGFESHFPANDGGDQFQGYNHSNPSHDTQNDFITQGGDSSYQYPVIAEHTEPIESGPFLHGIGGLTFSYGSDFSVDPDDPDAWQVLTNGAYDLSTGAGNDILYGSDGDNILVGNSGDDYLGGFADNDILYGGSGNDMLDGHSGNDTVYGGGGYDTVNLGAGEDVLVFNSDTFQDGSAIVEVNDFTLGEDGIKLEDGVTFEALRDYGTYTEAVLSNGTDDNVIVRLLGDSKADFDTHIDSLGAGYDYSASDTDQLVQYMAGNEGAWV